jgi:hypothetical protein
MQQMQTAVMAMAILITGMVLKANEAISVAAGVVLGGK